MKSGKKIGDMYVGASINPWIYLEDSLRCTEASKTYLAQLNYRNYVQTPQREAMVLEVDTLLKGDVQILLLHKAKNMAKFTMSLAKRMKIRTLIHSPVGYPALFATEMATSYPYITMFRYSFNTYFLGRNQTQPKFAIQVQLSDLDPVCMICYSIDR